MLYLTHYKKKKVFERSGILNYEKNSLTLGFNWTPILPIHNENSREMASNTVE